MKKVIHIIFKSASKNMKLSITSLLTAFMILSSCKNNQDQISPAEVEKLVAEAYVHTYPIVENYKGIYFYGVLKESPKYVPMNSLKNESVLYSPKDKFVVSPNNDTYYSTGILDLRAEPVIFKVPESKDRYYTFQFVGMTTDNFGYIGVNTTGPDSGTYAITSPNFNGKLPNGVKSIKSNSEFVIVAGRTAVNSEDSKDVQSALVLQKKFEVGPLSNFYPGFALKQVESVDFPALQTSDLDNENFFSLLNFLLQYIQLSKNEQTIIAGFEKIGVKKGEPYTFYNDNPDYQSAILQGIKIGITKVDSLANNMGRKVNGWDLTPTGEYFGNNYDLRTGWAKRAIYVNSPSEAYYPSISVDENGDQLNGTNTYSITFPVNNLPPAKYFWSLTMYYNDSKLMVENEINRYSFGDRTKGMNYNADGSLTIYFSKKAPKQGTANWLPAPEGDFYMLMRLYGPKEKVLKEEWTPPAILKLKD